MGILGLYNFSNLITTRVSLILSVKLTLKEVLRLTERTFFHPTFSYKKSRCEDDSIKVSSWLMEVANAVARKFLKAFKDVFSTAEFAS